MREALLHLGNRLSSEMALHRGAVTIAFTLALVTVVVALAGYPVLTRIMIGMMINLIFVVGLYVFVGNSGILSFGHMTFAGIAGYATAWLTIRPQFKALMLPGLPESIQQLQLPMFPSLILSALMAALVAGLVGIFLMRLNGIAASIGTLALLAIFYNLYSNLDSVTGGVGSLAGIPSGLTLFGVLFWVIVVLLIAQLHAHSASGLALRAVREDEAAALASGIRPFRVKIIAFVASAFICGIAGHLTARFLGVVSPTAFYLQPTFLALTMLIVGGSRSLFGAVSGVVVVTIISELLVRLEGDYAMQGVEIVIPAGTANGVLAVILCVVLAKWPRGLLTGYDISSVFTKTSIKGASR